MVMTDHPANDCYYHHCADITTDGSPSTDGGMSPSDASVDARDGGMSMGGGNRRGRREGFRRHGGDRDRRGHGLGWLVGLRRFVGFGRRDVLLGWNLVFGRYLVIGRGDIVGWHFAFRRGDRIRREDRLGRQHRLGRQLVVELRRRDRVQRRLVGPGRFVLEQRLQRRSRRNGNTIRGDRSLARGDARPTGAPKSQVDALSRTRRCSLWQ